MRKKIHTIGTLVLAAFIAVGITVVASCNNKSSHIVQFSTSVDGEKLTLYYDADNNNRIFYDPACKIPYLAPNDKPYIYANVDGIECFMEEYDEEDN